MTRNNRAKKQLRNRLEKLPDKLHDYQHPEGKSAQAERLRREEERRSLVEQRIQEAMANGEFDNLPGHGKPLNLNDNPYLEPGQEWAFGLLKRNGMAPEWIERDKAIRRDLAQARQRLQSARQRFRRRQINAAAWQAALTEFETVLVKLNRRIDDFNLVVPILSAQRPRLRLDNELRRLDEIVT